MSDHKPSYAPIVFALLGVLIAIAGLYTIGLLVIDAFGAKQLVENSEFNPATMWKFLLLLMPLAVIRAAALIYRQRAAAARRPRPKEVGIRDS